MNLIDWIAIGIIIVLVVLALKASHKNKCSGNCSSCHASCSNSKEPDFVRRYREDQAQAQENRR